MSAQLTDRWCSWCFKLTDHALLQASRLRRNSYECRCCKNAGFVCRYCENMSRAGKRWAQECCAVHDGTISSFPGLTESIADLTGLTELLRRRDGRNLVKAGKITALSMGGAAVLGPLAYAAAPALGAIVGSAMGLSGAAATSAGLAVIGGGSLATGGLGMAGGAMVLTAVGAGAGGVVGGVIANDYFGAVKGFEITKIRDGVDPALVFVDGWLTQKTGNGEAWLAGLNGRYEDRAAYYVSWESKRLLSLGQMLGRGVLVKGLKEAAVWAAKRGSKTATRRVGPLSIPLITAELLKNPWHVAMVKAEMVGELLKEAIVRTPGREFILFGHSLGARVLYSALSSLASVEVSRRSRVVDAHFLGGAVGNSPASDWDDVEGAVERRLHNYRSSQDGVLKYMYTLGTLFASHPIGRYAITRSGPGAGKIVEHDVSGRVDGHTAYRGSLRSLLGG